MSLYGVLQLNNMYKIGLLYCKKGQSLEEEMYNNGEYVYTCVYPTCVSMCVCLVCVCLYVCIPHNVRA